MKRSCYQLSWFLVLSLAGCAATSDRASELAKAGIAYTNAVPSAMDEATRIKIEADAVNLEILRETGAAAGHAERRKALNEADSVIRQRADIIALLKKQTAQLGDYFVALGGLADSKAPASAEAATTAAVSNLEKLAPSLTSASLPVPGGSSIKVGNLLPAAVNLLVRNAQNRAISDELDRNANIIERQLALQEAAIDAIGLQAEANLDTIYQDQQLHSVFEPYLDSKPLPVDWAQRRVTTFAERTKPRAIGEAQVAAAKLRASWIAFAEGDLGSIQIDDLIASIEKLTSLLQREEVRRT